MDTLISGGVKVSVETFYQQDYSSPLQNEFMFAYRITIENTNTFAVRLISRFWDIMDSDGGHREVEGEGVVGMQPVIGCGEEYQYVSGCNLHTELGQMFGYYKMQNQASGEIIQVGIPRFMLEAPFKRN